MARARMLAAAASTDPQLNQISKDAQLLYLLSIPHLDRDGLIDGRPQVLWAAAAVLRIELLGKAPALVQEWVDIGLVIRYDGPDGPALFFKGFRKHNSNLPYKKEPVSKFPPPPGWVRTRQGLVPGDEEACFRLLSQFDSRSNYYRELESRISRDLLATLSRPSRDEDQDQAEVEDQDQAEVEAEENLFGVVGGFATPVCLVELLFKSSSTRDDRAWVLKAMRITAADLMAAIDWKGIDAYLDTLNDICTSYLLCWLSLHPKHGYTIYLDGHDSDAFATAKNPIGLIRHHVKERTNPELSRWAYKTLAAYILWADAMANVDNPDDYESWQWANDDYRARIQQAEAQ